MADSYAFDTIVIGSGLAGFAAALALKEKSKRVALVFKASGATSVSSGSWDLGPIPREGASLSALLTSNPWQKIFSDLLLDSVLPLSAEEIQANLGATLEVFKEALPFSTAFDRSFLLPCMSGGLRRTFCVQESQAAADLHAPRGKRYALVGSRRWRFRADLLSRQWNEELRKRGSSVEFRALDLPLEGEGWDIPLTRVSAGLERNEIALDQLKEAIARLSDSVDGMVLPPIFPSAAAFEAVRSSTILPIAEALAWTEPVAGYRLWKAMQRVLDEKSIPSFSVQQIQVQPAGGRIRDLTVLFPASKGWTSLKADSFVLASGRFFGGGLQGSFHRFEESIFALPLYSSRTVRIAERGATLEIPGVTSTLGLQLDKEYRPLAEDGKPSFQNLVAAGSIVGGVDYVRHQVGLGWFCFTGRRSVASFV